MKRLLALTMAATWLTGAAAQNEGQGADTLSANPTAAQRPYRGYTGTVHHLGFVGGLYATANPNYTGANDTQRQTFYDYGLGAAYTLHDYVTRQFTIDLITSVTVITGKTLQKAAIDDAKQKIVWPVDCRLYLGPSEDFQAYIGTGLQWNLLSKTTGDYDLLAGETPTKTIHQLSGNTAVGLNFFGPQNYMVHLNIGAKLHYTIADNDDTPMPADGTTDLSRDRSCVILNAGITVDIDRRKNACLMLNYEYPLGTPKAAMASSSIFRNTQTISLGLMFHVGGTR